MVVTWDSVASNPAYQALPQEQKDAARQQYFNDVVAPQIPQEHLDIARKQFDSYSTPKSNAPKEPGLMSRIGTDISNRGTGMAEALLSNMKGEQGLPSTALQIAGGTGGALMDIGTETAKSLTPNFVKSGAESGAQGVASAIDSTGIGQKIGDSLLQSKDAITDWAKNNPVAARNAEAVLNIQGAAPALSGLNTARKGLAEAGDKAALSLARPEGVFPKAMAPEIPALDPLTYHQSIGATYGAAKGTAGKYYDFMQSLTEGRPAENADKIGNSLSSIIEDISSDPLHEGRSQLGKLKLLSDKIDSGDFGLSDAVDLKKTINTHFDPKRFSQSAGDVPYLKLGATLDKSLAESSKIYPDFGMAKELSDKNWLNTVKKPFEDNPVLKKFWQPSDYYNHIGFEDGRLDYLPDETTQRVDTLVKNIKSPSQLNALTRVAPETQAEALKAAKLADITKGQATSRLGAAGKAITGLPNIVPHPLTGTRDVLTNIGEAIGGPKLTAEQQALIDALKSPSPKLSNYGKEYQEIKDWAGQPHSSWLGQKSIPAPTEKLALPAPDSPQFIAGSDGVKLASPEERDASIALQSNPDVKGARAARADQTPSKVLNTELMQRKNAGDAISAWDRAAQNLSGQGYKFKEIEFKLGKRPEDLPEYAKGGHVRKNLTAEFLARAAR